VGDHQAGKSLARPHKSSARNAMTSAKLKQRVLLAGGWSMAGFGLSQIIRFGSNLLMTRLLVPEMFGVMAIASIVMYGLALFSDVGLRQNIVQSKRGNDGAILNTAWSIQILRGLLIWFCALAISVLVAIANHAGLVPQDSVYMDTSLPYVIAVMSISAVIMGVESTKLSVANRNLALGSITLIEIGSQLIGLLCMLTWVSFDRSIWALVAGGLFSSLARAILSHTSLPGLSNRWQWDHSAFREIIHFGKWIFLSSILGFLVNSGDRLLLSNLLNTTTLGVYVIAYFIFSAVEQSMSKVITDVSFPALSEVARDRPRDLRQTCYRFHIVIASFAYCCAGILMISGQTLIALLYDARYAQAGWMLEILATALLVSPVNITTQCFMALGMPKFVSYLCIIRLLILFIVAPVLFYFFGLPGILWGIVLSYLSCLPVTFFYKVKYNLFDLRKELAPTPLLLAGAVIGEIFNSVIA